MVALLVQRMHVTARPTSIPKALADQIHDRFLCAYLATENSGQKTREAARAVAEEIGASFIDGKIQPALSRRPRGRRVDDRRALSWSNPRHDITLQNIQARVRGMLIWTLANLHNALLLVTSNKSEAAVGYTTMDGDSSGGLAPIADVPKSLIKLYLDWATDFHGFHSSKRSKAMEASAELRPPGQEQTDEADLMPFPVLDQLMYAFVQLALDPLEIFTRYWPTMTLLFDNDARQFSPPTFASLSASSASPSGSENGSRSASASPPSTSTPRPASDSHPSRPHSPRSWPNSTVLSNTWI